MELLHTETATALEAYFASFRENIVGQHQNFETPYGVKRLLYADWTASGRLYRQVEDKLLRQFGPFVGNTHTETNVTGTSMTLAYHEARKIIKRHVNAGSSDCIISYGSGMTGVINKFQRILGLRVPDRWREMVNLTEQQRPIVFVTHMEHHSNQTSWLETLCDMEVIGATPEGLVDLTDLDRLLEKYRDRKAKIAAVTACSNVTGIRTPYHQIAARMHHQGGFCFVDFACSAPYVEINMHPEDEDERLDAIYFSPHKFLGGPGTSGVLIFNARLYDNRVPDNPGGGTVKWTNPWNERDYIDDIEDREDGGTPPFLQTIQTALCVRLKEQMGVDNMLQREEELLQIIFERLQTVPQISILAGHIKDRLGVISFTVEGLHYNLGVRLLNDKYGIQVRGGCSCAGTYGHYLLHVDRNLSHELTCEISHGNLAHKPGWIRMSIHPTMTDAEIHLLCDALQELAEKHGVFAKEYTYSPLTNEFHHQNEHTDELEHRVRAWFDL